MSSPAWKTSDGKILDTPLLTGGFRLLLLCTTFVHPNSWTWIQPSQMDGSALCVPITTCSSQELSLYPVQMAKWECLCLKMRAKVYIPKFILYVSERPEGFAQWKVLRICVLYPWDCQTQIEKLSWVQALHSRPVWAWTLTWMDTSKKIVQPANFIAEKLTFFRNCSWKNLVDLFIEVFSDEKKLYSYWIL